MFYEMMQHQHALPLRKGFRVLRWWPLTGHILLGASGLTHW